MHSAVKQARLQGAWDVGVWGLGLAARANGVGFRDALNFERNECLAPGLFRYFALTHHGTACAGKPTDRSSSTHQPKMKQRQAIMKRPTHDFVHHSPLPKL